MTDHRQRARYLINLAADKDTPEQERVSAALQAVGIIHKYNLLANPIDDLMGSQNETLRAGAKVIDRIMDPDFVSDVKTVGRSIFSGLGNASSDAGGGRRRRRRRR